MSLDIRPNPSAAGSVTGGLSYKGSYNATTNTPDLTSSLKGDFYIVSVGGTLAGVTLDVGDHIVFNQDASSPITSAMFDKIDNTDAVASVNTQTGVVVLDTDDISEGTSNLYYTNTRADGRIAAANMTDLNDVNYTAGAGIDGQFLKYVNANSRWEAASAPASSDTLDDVVGRGSTTTDSITTGGLTVTGDIDPNTDATYYIGNENARFISYYGDMNGAIRFKAKVDETGGLDAGEVVYIKGVSGTVPTVGKAQANSSSTMPAFGLVFADANDTADVEIITFGNLGGLDTSLLTLNSNLFVSSTTAGGLVETAPSGESNLIQNIGFVVRSDNGSGIIKVGGAGRSNATPNLNQDKIFLGNASNQAVSTALSSVNLSSFNNNLDTDDISEGTSNLYYTNARFDTQLATKDTDDLSEGATNLYYTNARFDTQLATKDTGDLSEGANLYYTNARADARIAAADMTDLNDVNYTAGAGIDGKFLKYVNANNRWEAADAPAGAVSSVNTQTGAVVLDTDDISEGTSNLYYTNARFDTQLATKDTDDLSEGTTNLYFTNTRADGRIAAADLTDLNDVNYTAGSGINNYVLTYVHATTRWEAKEATGGGSALPPEVKETTTTTPVSVSLTPSDSNSYTDLEVMYLVNNSSTAVELDLPTASGNEGKKIHIKRTGTADVTIDPNGTEQIDNGGAGTAFVLTSQYQSVSLISNGTNWFIF
jgi:hypothetical protein